MDPHAGKSISVVLPAFNEALNIEKSVGQAVKVLTGLGADWEVVIVDDGSRDDTGAIIDRMAERDPRIVPVHHAKNAGYGGALTTGIRTARMDLVLLCDSDLQFDLGEIPLLLRWIDDHDAVIGYRATRCDPWMRKFNAWGWNMLVRLSCHVKARDVDCAFKLYRRAIFDGFQIESRGAMVSAEILAKIGRLGLRVKEVPVSHFCREAGCSTGANLRVIAKAFRELARTRASIMRVQPRANGAAPEPAGVGALKVAMVLASPFPANHGTPAGVKEAAQAVAARGHEVHVVAYHFGDAADPQGMRVHRIPGFGLGGRIVVGPTLAKPLLDALLVLRVIAAVWRHRIDLIHAHNFEGALAAYLASLVTRRPVIYNAVCTMGDELESYGVFPPRVARALAAFLDRWVPRWADHIVSISPELATSLQKTSGVPPQKIATIPLGVSFAPFAGTADVQAVRARLGLGSAPLVVYTGTLDRFQRVDYLMKAMRRVVDAMPDARLLLAGGVTRDEDVAACRSMADELGLSDKVVIVTGSTFEEIPAILAAAQVAVAPRPACPGVPIKLLNYIGAAKPIVTFEGSAKGLVNMKTALLAPDHDWEELGECILDLLKDGDLAAEMGCRAHQWAQDNLTWSMHAQRLEAVYCSVLDPSWKLPPKTGAPLQAVEDEAPLARH